MSVRVGIIGAGAMAQFHLANLIRMPDVEVVAISDLSSEQLQATPEAVRSRALLNAPDGDWRLEAASYADYNVMLQKERLDAAYVCVPPFADGDPEEAVAHKGLPMLVEKPVALTLPVAAKVLEGLRRNKVWAASGYQLRYAPELQNLKKRLAGNTLGMALCMRLGGYSIKKGWLHRQDLSGGKLIENTTHQVDVLRLLAGEVKTVYAAGATRINHRYTEDYDIFDVHCLTLTFENGAVGSLSVNEVSLKGGPQGARGTHLFYDGLTVSIPNAAEVITIVSREGTEEIKRESDMLWEEDRAFVQAVAGGQPDLILSDYESGVRTLAVTVAADISARTGEIVNINDLLQREAPAALERSA